MYSRILFVPDFARIREYIIGEGRRSIGLEDEAAAYRRTQRGY